MSITFSLASREDDAGIRRLLATNPMPGRIRVRFEREPEYFAGCASMGPFTQVLVAKDEDRIVGVACRAVRKVFVNGKPEDVGYLGQLRVDRAYRGRLLTARGFRMLRELHSDGRVRGYFTTIVDDNGEAEGVLVRKARSSMPRYRFLDRLFTLAIAARSAPHPSPLPASGERGNRESPLAGCGESEHGESPLPACGERVRVRGVPLDLLTRLGPTRNLFPADDPQGEVIAVNGGVAALNDQRAFKQTVIDGYDRGLSLVRPLYNLVASIPLPKPGTALKHAYVTHFCVADDDPATACELIEALRAAAAQRGLDHILLGFTERDPLLRVARRFKPVEYPSSIYTVAWDDGDDLHDRLDSRPVALDLAAL